MHAAGAAGLHCESLCEERPPLPAALFSAIAVCSQARAPHPRPGQAHICIPQLHHPPLPRARSPHQRHSWTWVLIEVDNSFEHRMCFLRFQHCQ